MVQEITVPVGSLFFHAQIANVKVRLWIKTVFLIRDKSQRSLVCPSLDHNRSPSRPKLHGNTDTPKRAGLNCHVTAWVEVWSLGSFLSESLLYSGFSLSGLKLRTLSNTWIMLWQRCHSKQWFRREITQQACLNAAYIRPLALWKRRTTMKPCSVKLCREIREDCSHPPDTI